MDTGPGIALCTSRFWEICTIFPLLVFPLSFLLAFSLGWFSYGRQLADILPESELAPRIFRSMGDNTLSSISIYI